MQPAYQQEWHTLGQEPILSPLIQFYITKIRILNIITYHFYSKSLIFRTQNNKFESDTVTR